jgi:hypothetical protein
MDTRKTILGAAAVLAAGVVSMTSAHTATAQPQDANGRITSIDQLKTSIHQAVAIEAASVDEISCCPAGYYSAPESL